ncbi:hypothetical protein MIR68_006854 [Amoeboaphelidium protococcarum]|nr:hypothetical protein MIR68_006854 [Amoeboaphelidium protococcarum]
MSDTNATEQKEGNQKLSQLSLDESKVDSQKDIEKVTDFSEEATLDVSKINNAMNFLSTDKGQPAVKTSQQDTADNSNGPAKKMNKILIKKEDIESLMREFNMSKAMAEKYLKKHSGNLLECALDIMNSNTFPF